MDRLKELQRMRFHERVSRRITTAAPYMIALLLVSILFLTTRLAATTEEVRQTAAYTRTTNCILGKGANPPITQDEIERCYVQVEKSTGQSLERFDEQTKGEN